MRLDQRLAGPGRRLAIVSDGGTFSYDDLHARAGRVAAALLASQSDLGEARVGMLLPPGCDFVSVLLGIHTAGGIAVPLALSHPRPELEHVIDDAAASIVVTTPELRGRLPEGMGATPVDVADLIRVQTPPRRLPDIGPERRALIVYTSGTTGRPKGVVTTHANITAQIQSLVDAWAWQPDDRALLVLPLHHVHGLINVVGCAIWTGAVCEMVPSFDAATTWHRLASGDISVFTAVPTIYHQLVAAYEAADRETQQRWAFGCRSMRLMMSGSAALPIGLFERWRAITGHDLLERYGMTELGMALSNPLHGRRRRGTVGTPLPGVDVRLVDTRGEPANPGTPGELEVRGPTVFLEYWRQPVATRDAFRDGWFRTGDIAVVQDGAYRLLGRASTDILKSGGFKVSALEVEETLRDHPAIAECAVVGVDDAEWGQRVAVAVELRGGSSLTLDELSGWARERLAPYKVPRALRCVAALPRNAMGKIVKAQVAAMFDA